MRSLAKAQIVAALTLFASAAWGLEYPFIVPGVTLDSDASAEYTAANAPFGNLQSKGNFRPGDLIDFTYADGAIAQFELVVQGSRLRSRR